MQRGIITLGIPTLAVILFAALYPASPSYAACEAPEASNQTRVIDARINKSVHYAFPAESQHGTPGTSTARRSLSDQALGAAAPVDVAGALVGNTFNDYQHIGAVGRMIGHGLADNGKYLIHFSWAYLPGPTYDAMDYRYDFYNVTDITFGVEIGLQPPEEYGGYVNLDITNGGRAILGGQNREASDYITDPQFYWDFAPGAGFFGYNDQVPQSLQYYGQSETNATIWPKFAYAEGTDTVLHVIAMEDGTHNYGGLYYFRRVGTDTDPSATWTDPPRIIDSIYVQGYSIDAHDDGKVAIAWTALLPCDASDPDTASGLECRQFVQWDNDIYYQTSDNYGASWNPRVNLTKNIVTEGQQTGDYRMYRPFAETSTLLDSQGDLHLVWNARYWPADANNGGDAGLKRGRIFHWSEDRPYIRTAHSFDWDQTVCSPGAFNLTTSDISISECNGRFYILFTQFNDIPNGVEDDCAVSSNPGFPEGSANGDLYVTMSEDDGLSWGVAYNITQTYTPGCDSVGGVGGPCYSEVYGSLTKFGTQTALDPGDAVVTPIIVPNATDNGWYLDGQYVLDKSAGTYPYGEGTWEEAEVRWFRLGCYQLFGPEPIVIDPWSIEYPEFVMPCQEKRYTVTITNNGQSDVPYTLTPEEDTPSGDYSGWLTVEGSDGIAQAGLNNVDSFTIVLNTGAILCETPGMIISELIGRVNIDLSGGYPSQATIEIDVPLVENVVGFDIDTISTTCHDLGIVNNGSYGRQGTPGLGLDYVGAGDCDTSATTYLYDGSPFVGWIDGVTGDTVMNWSIFGTSYLDEPGFVQLSDIVDSADSDNEIRKTTFVTHDSSVTLERTWYAPQAEYACEFVIQKLRVYATDGADRFGLTIGEAVDWDIPSDTSARNGSSFIDSKNLIYMFGGEYDQDDTTECIDNNRRFGGLMYLDGYLNDTGGTEISPQYNAYTASNADYVYPNLYGFDAGQLYGKIDSTTGYWAFYSSDPDSQLVDLHMIMTYVHNQDLPAGDTLIFWSALLTEYDAALYDLELTALEAENWFCDKLLPGGCGCFTIRGDCDCDYDLDVADVACIVDVLFRGHEPCCWENLDINGSGGSMNISDLTYLVDYMFRGGPPPPP